ncbi:MAG: peptide ABC transporter substrate-binding protein [Chloroflexi bacterium]|nr:peptide ABC transporter substrate-binding protein [Chloroflexota bacterium]
MRKKWLVTPFVLIALAAIACGEAVSPGPDNPQEPAAAPAAAAVETPQASPTAEASQAPAPATKEPQAAAAPSGTGRTGGIFRRMWADPPTLDPHLTSDTTSAGIVVEVFSGLITLDTDLSLQPDIAERWEISEDGTVYTFFLRKNAKFHDGKPITAQDFVWSLNRAASPSIASPVASTYLNDIVGVNEVLSGEATRISGVKAIDENTLQITIDGPKAYFLAKLTYPTAFVLDRENVESAEDWRDNPNGSGPFRLKEYKVGERIILERNELFYLEPAKLDQVFMNLAGGQAMAMYENDEIDITGVGLFDLERLRDPSEPLSSDLKVAPPGFSVSYIGFNPNEPPFDDLNFRLALNHAIDKELIAEEVLAGLRVPAYGVLPPGFPGFDPTIKGLRFDPEKAVRLLEESNYADPDSRPRIVITVPGTGGNIGLDMEVILEMWRQNLGVEVEIQQVEWATFLQDLNRKRFQAFAGLAWQADYPDPQDFLDILFHTDSDTNHGGYSNPKVDALLEEARIERDVQKRFDLYNQAERTIINDAAWVPLWYTGERYLLLKPYIKDYALTPMTVPKLRKVYIEE